MFIEFKFIYLDKRINIKNKFKIIYKNNLFALNIILLFSFTFPLHFLFSCFPGKQALTFIQLTCAFRYFD